MAKTNLFEKARLAALIKTCDGCGETKSIDEFKKGNKWCNKCPKLEEIREKYRNKVIDTSISTQDIQEIDLDDFFRDL